MTLNLLSLPAHEAESLAYAEGFTMAAELFARIAELESINRALNEELEDLKEKRHDDSLTRWEDEHGSAEAYKDFFFSCYERLSGHYPCPSVTSDYDCSVILDAIERGETVREEEREVND